MLNMKNLDRLVALLIVAFFVSYIYLSFNFELLPFERRMSFKPDTMPRGIGILGLILALVVLFTAEGAENKDNANWKKHDYKRYFAMIVAMVLYAIFLKTAGFVVATMGFLIAGAMILGERNYIKLSVISLIGALLIWFVVDRLLGIYLYPVPSFIQL
ncbi:MAG: tripartite tricarboxylate transporter TctB family protein [Gammaproteobacteria bacterium]|nr:tripartite tricarboxylate transporter TctB family protein [Gammaproteobacteria bacterium]